MKFLHYLTNSNAGDRTRRSGYRTNFRYYLWRGKYEVDWIPEDNNTATCDGIEEINSIEIDATNPLYYGNGQIVIQFEMSVQSRLNYAIFEI